MSDLRDEITGHAPEPAQSKIVGFVVLVAILAVVAAFFLCPDLTFLITP